MSASNAATPTMRLACLTGQRVFITGSATGIGASIVQAFASQGADVAWLTPEASAELFRTQCLPDR